MSRNFFVAVLSVLATFASQASGAADPGVAARVEHRYVQGASDVLSRFVKPRDFNVTAEATVLSGKSIPAMKDAAIARLLMHLEPMRTARLLNLLQTENLDQYPRVTRQLSFIADAVLRSELDREILDGLRQAQGGQESNNRKFFVSYYKELLDNVGEDVGEQIVQQPVNDPMLKERVVANHITVNQFFGMEGELRAEILQGVGGKDLAAWVATLSDGQRNVILAALPEKRREIIGDDVRQIAGNKGMFRKARRQGQTVRGRILTAMKELKASGEWTPAALPAELV